MGGGGLRGAYPVPHIWSTNSGGKGAIRGYLKLDFAHFWLGGGLAKGIRVLEIYPSCQLKMILPFISAHEHAVWHTVWSTHVCMFVEFCNFCGYHTTNRNQVSNINSEIISSDIQ